MDEFYMDQAGSGITVFRGERFQKGHGLLSSFGATILPLIKKVLPYLGEQALRMGSDIVSGIGRGTEPTFKGAVTSAAKKRAASITEDALVKVRSMQGHGKRRRRTKSIRSRCVQAKKTKIIRKKIENFLF
ncbi:hypothetical protein HDE_10360 [Halotydeus destructor]|nr:hypothetical protein HDE_10360 [Halotydeus destructor]